MNIQMSKKAALLVLVVLLSFACQKQTEQRTEERLPPAEITYCVNIGQLSGKEYLSEKYLQAIEAIETSPEKARDLEGMVLVPGGTFEMGADQPESLSDLSPTASPQADEFPKHPVQIADFYMDEHEVTVGEFLEFVEATGYQTVAECDMDWEELKKQLPPGTPEPDEELLQAGALVFHLLDKKAVKNESWWSFVKGACWKNPNGESPELEALMNHPVTQISWYDALAYAKWVGKRLPTEAEFEYAMRAGAPDKMYPWGNERVTDTNAKGNFLQGQFPYIDTGEDGYIGTAPVKSFAPNAYGLYDMAGNVWEWTSDWYSPVYYKKVSSQTAVNPKGPSEPLELRESHATNKVVRGGSFLCHDSYCSGFRNARRMRLSPDTGMEHVGFRLVRSKR